VKASVGSLLSWAPFCVAAAVAVVASKLFSYLDKSSKVETSKRKMFACKKTKSNAKGQ
jgi:hypothetical protein